MKNILFLEWVNTNSNINCSFQKIIYIYPDVGYYYKLKDLDCVPIETYYEFNDLYSLKEKNDYKLFEIIEFSDKKIIENVSYFREKNIKPFLINRYNLKLMLDMIHISIFEVLNVLNKEHPEKVYIYQNHKLSVNGLKLNFLSNEAIYSEVIKCICKSKNIPFEIIPVNQDDLNFLNKIVMQDPQTQKKKIQSIKIQLKKILMNFKAYFLNKLNNKKFNILYCNGRFFYSSNLKKLLIKEGFNLINYNSKNFLKKANELFLKKNKNYWNLFNDDIDFKKLFEFESVNYYEIIKDKLEGFIKNIDIIYYIYILLSEFINKNKIDLIISSTFSYGAGITEPILGYLADNEKIKSIIGMHGAQGVFEYTDSFQYTDFPYADYYFVFGKAIKENLQKKYISYKYIPKKSMNFFVTGCPFFYFIKRKNNTNTEKKKIVYCLKNFLKTNKSFLWNDPLWFDNLYFDLSLKIINILKEFQNNYNIIIKLYPSNVYNYKNLYIQYLGKEKNMQVISNEKSFENLLFETDLFIFDWISCPFFQAMLTEAEIFVYTKIDLTSTLKDSLIDAVYLFTDNFSEFKNALSDFLQKFYLEKTLNNNQNKKNKFLKLYLSQNYYNNILVNRKIVDQIVKIIEEIKNEKTKKFVK
ncbi:MAG TPA: hypothetical protein PKX90_10785 [bacterium]|nr:hypothetical protein [bacterium]